jgi:hypothetical protein
MSSCLRSARSLLVPSGTENEHHPTRLRKRALAAPLSVERLEDRTVPSTFMVGNLADSGPGSLRQAIFDANDNPGADLIRFASPVGGTLTLTSGQMSITDDLTIDGPGVHRLTISGNDASRVFSVSGSATDVEIRDLTIANGRATDATVVGPVGPVTLGGALLNTGARVVLSDVTMANNQAVGAIALGGAIANVFGASLVVTDGTFTANRAAGTIFGSAGAILNEGGGSVLVLDHSTFTGNQATASLGAGPLINQGNAVGGAVKNTAGGQATVLHTTFAGNLAHGGDGADGGPGQKGGDAGFGVAGALENAYYGLVGPNASSTMTVADSTFLANRALGGTGGAGGAGAAGGNGRGGPGGAISNAGSTLTISHSTFIGNLSLAGNGGNGGVGGNGGAGGTDSGGAINSSNPVGGVPVFATLHISDSLFQGNEATAGAGGSGGIGGSGGNGGDGQGGAISNGSSTLTVSHSTFLGNQVLGGSGGNGGNSGNGGNGGNGFAGAINNSTGSAGKRSDWDVRDSSFAFNQVTGGAGGDRGSGGLLGGTGGAGRGGALINLNGSIGTLSDSIVILNTATGGAGGVGGSGGNGQGGGVFNGGPSALGTRSLTLQRSLVVLNQADGGAAGDGGSGGLGQGGGLYLTPGGVACADPLTAILANDASTSDDDIFGDLGVC